MKAIHYILAGSCAACLSVAAGCYPPRTVSATQPPAPATTAPATRPTTQSSDIYNNPSAGIRLTEPAGYSTRPSNDVDLLLVPAGQPATPIDSVSLEIPDLPVHIPGFIPLGLVVNGYVSDMKKSHPGVAIEQNQAYSIPAAKAWIVKSKWPDGQATDSETAILIVHDDHVFILRANADAAGLARTMKDYDAFVKSVQWTK
jgi:hypothetical protein